MALHDFGSVIDLEEKAVSEDNDVYTFTGYAAVFNNVDQGNDVILPGAFKHSLEKHGLPLLCFQHKMDEVVGCLTDAREDKKGLWVKGEMPKDDDFVRGRLVPQLKRRGIRGMSIGYKSLESERRKSDGARLLKKLRCFETSFVSLAMNPLAGVESVKGLVPFADLRIDREAKTWDAAAAFKRLREHFKDDADAMKQAFLYIDPDKSVDEWDTRFLIGDVDESGCVKAANHALLRVPACLYGSRQGDSLPEEVGDAVKSVLDRYFQRLDLESPAKSLSVSEWSVLDAGEREARLRGFGVSQRLAKQLVFGQRDADRSQGERDVRPNDDALKLISTALIEAVAAIKR